MDFGKLPLFSLMSQRMAWLGKRQQVLAHNIANANTPGYRAQDLKEPSFKQLMQGADPSHVRMAVTHTRHMGGGQPANPQFKVVEDRDAEVTLLGNSVTLEDQVTKVAKAAMDHQVTVNLYRKHISMIKTALGRPGT